MADQAPDPDTMTRATQFTKTMHREMYPAIDPTNPANSAEGKYLLLTGASRGIGKAIALAWATAGVAGIVLTGRSVKDLDAVAEQVKAKSPKTEVLVKTADITSPESIHELWAAIKAKFGKVNVLINNAGTLNGGLNALSPIGEIDPKKWWLDFETNVRAPYLHVHHFIHQFENSSKPEGTIIFLSSGAASLTLPGGSSYSITKLADLRLVEYLDVEQPSIRTFAVHPGMVPTDMQVDALAPFTRDPAELTGGMSLYLATPRADHLRGGYVTVNWDVEEMEAHKEEILEKRLLHTGFLNAKLGPEGHPFQK